MLLSAKGKILVGKKELPRLEKIEDTRVKWSYTFNGGEEAQKGRQNNTENIFSLLSFFSCAVGKSKDYI